MTTVTPRIIPRDILSKDEQAIFDSLTQPERDIQYKWWSMHDILKYYHSGFITLENDANFFNFKIDLTKAELADMKYRDPQLVAGINQSMDNLNDVTTAIANRFIQEKAKFAQQQQDSTMRALTPNRQQGGKKRKQKGGIFAVDPNEDISMAFSKDKLREECMNDLFKDTFTSRNRIFLVDSLPLPLYTAQTAEALKQAMDQTKAEFAQQATAPTPNPGANLNLVPAPVVNLGTAPGQTVVGGRIIKTRKGKKGHKKSRTRKHKLPFGKR